MDGDMLIMEFWEFYGFDYWINDDHSTNDKV